MIGIRRLKGGLMMKLHQLVQASALVLATCLMSCGTVRKVSKATTNLVSSNKPVPETSWNAERTWKLISDEPPTYIPYNFIGKPISNGEWLRDERDGKRLYVPKGGVEGIPESVLRAEAWKATHD